MDCNVSALLDRIQNHSDEWIVLRKPDNYDRFMNLLLSVNYPSVDPSQMFGWRQRTCETWRFQDELFPGNCAGGEEEQSIVSTLGALPISRSILYVHSGAMQRTLKAALTLLAVANHTIDFMYGFSEINWWMGLYTYQSRFVTLWQRPEQFSILGQVEVEEIRVYPLQISTWVPPAPMDFVPLSPGSHRSQLTEAHAMFADMLLDTDEIVGHHYQLRGGFVSAANNAHKCVALIGDAKDESTAFNVPNWVWIFPCAQTAIDERLVTSLCAVGPLKGRVLRIVINRQDDVPLWESPYYRLIRAFIALTPRNQLHQLRRSLRDAFTPLIAKYSDQELKSLI